MELKSEFNREWFSWRKQWSEFLKENQDFFSKPVHGADSYFFELDKNWLADEVLGVWDIGDKQVELSEVTCFGSRSIGIAFGTAPKKTFTPERGIVYSFDELKQELGMS